MSKLNETEELCSLFEENAKAANRMTTIVTVYTTTEVYAGTYLVVHFMTRQEFRYNAGNNQLPKITFEVCFWAARNETYCKTKFYRLVLLPFVPCR